MGLQVNEDDVEKLLEDHREELNTDQILDHLKEHKQTGAEVIASKKETVEYAAFQKLKKFKLCEGMCRALSRNITHTEL